MHVSVHEYICMCGWVDLDMCARVGVCGFVYVSGHARIYICEVGFICADTCVSIMCGCVCGYMLACMCASMDACVHMCERVDKCARP